jgi:hypothetical protein
MTTTDLINELRAKAAVDESLAALLNQAADELEYLDERVAIMEADICPPEGVTFP